MTENRYIRNGFVFLLAIQILIYGCAVYHPQSTDIPLIDHKGELRIDAGASVIPSAYSTISYGLSNNIALQAFASVGIEERFFSNFHPDFTKPYNTTRLLNFMADMVLAMQIQ